MRMAHYFHGANAGEKIIAAIADLPATGGIVDARGFEGDQNITSNMFAGLSKPLVLFLGAARFIITVTQSIVSVNNLSIIGCTGSGDTSVGGIATNLTWSGTNGGTVLFLDRCRDSYFKHLCITPGAGTIGIGIRIDATGAGVSTNNSFHAINVGASTTGIQIGNTSTGGNDSHKFIDVYISGAGTYGYHIENAQSKYHLMKGGAVKLRTHGIHTTQGSFQAEGMMNGSNINDFSLGAATDTILIKSCYSEGSNRFLNAASGPTANAFPVVLMTNVASPDNVGVDHIFLQYKNRGALIMIGNVFARGNADATLIFDTDAGAYGGCRIVSIGNNWWDVSALWTTAPLNNDLVSIGDTARGASSEAVQMPLLLGDGWNGAAPAHTAVVLGNGANNNIVIPAAGFIKIEGPTGAFSISGFLSYTPAARRLQVYNSTAQQMTISNLTGSTSGYQIRTMTGADVVLRTGTSFATFLYDPVALEWLLTGIN
jgi:hypothetical protein